jgi:hypothetical protein
VAFLAWSAAISHSQTAVEIFENHQIEFNMMKKFQLKYFTKEADFLTTFG